MRTPRVGGILRTHTAPSQHPPGRCIFQYLQYNFRGKLRLLSHFRISCKKKGGVRPPTVPHRNSLFDSNRERAIHSQFSNFHSPETAERRSTSHSSQKCAHTDIRALRLEGDV
jgi:hypothetical protein